jgi:hypothetical protein
VGEGRRDDHAGWAATRRGGHDPVEFEQDLLAHALRELDRAFGP